MRVLGMMSGTSLDAIDVAVVEFHRDSEDPGLAHARILHHGEHPWPVSLRSQLLAVLPPAGSDVGTWCRLHARVGEVFAEAAAAALEQTRSLSGSVGRDAQQALANLICTHGQTLYHWVHDACAHGTLQIGDPSRIAAATGLPVLHDVRAADIARGGHGAPLAPILDQLIFGDRPTAAINIGGIANVALVGTDTVVCGDIGPGNALIDAAVHAATNGRLGFDRDGELARAGRVDTALLHALLDDPFYTAPLPRSTGREHFDSDYVDRLAPGSHHELADLIATLTELTALLVARTVHDLAAERVVLSGGGIRNPVLHGRIIELMAQDGVDVLDSESIGLPPDAKEAVLMALIGWLSLEQVPAVPTRADGTTVTGARSAALLGSLTPPSPMPAAQLPGHPVHHLLLPRFSAPTAASGDGC